ncbi:ABC transporter ATP-binding protein, partial [Microbacterium sp.]|uniref:ABC transporter ATP-binding protein n=1 Tax=Microbacterium sp. TaxID=51671 RepID=UPI003A83C6FF
AMSYPAILLRPAVTALLTPVAAALTLALLDWRFTAAILAMIAVTWLVSRLGSRLARTVDTRQHTVSAEATRRILEFADRQPLVRTDQRPEDTDTLDHALGGVEEAARRSAGTVIPAVVLFSVTLNAAFAGLVGLGVLWLADATLTIPALLGVLVAAARLTAIAAAGAELAAGLRLQAGILERLAAVLDAPALPALPATRTVKHDDELVRVEHVSFGYDTEPVLQDVSFTLPRRGLIAVVGPSGSGKTTLARLLARFWDPTEGRVLIDGSDVRSLSQEDITAMLAIVMQDDYVVEGTIAENIRLGDATATDAAVTAAAESTGLGALLADLPEGIETEVGSNGSRLSGGQRQRVCVARALLKSAPLTILDEATSALDPENARLVVDAASRLATTGAVLVIAHNLETAIRADRILVIDGGRLVQQGHHAELAEQTGLYRQLLEHAASPHTAASPGSNTAAG